MQTITSREAQTRFGKFSREAQRDTIVVTSHGQPVFITIPVRTTSSIAKLISEVSPRDGIDGGKAMRQFFAELETKRPKNPSFTEDEINALIKSSND